MVALQTAWLAVRSSLIGSDVFDPAWSAAIASLALALATAAAPAPWFERADAALRSLAEDDRRAATAVGLAALAVAVATALSQQPFTWDERFMFPSAALVSERGLGVFFARYASLPWLGTNHPPLVVVLFGLVLRLAGFHLLALRLVTALVGAATVVVAHAVARRLVDRETALLAALLLLTSPLFDRMTSAAMNDIFVTFFFVWAVLLTVRPVAQGASGDDGRGDVRAGALLGVVIGAGLLCKYTMLLVYPVVAAIALLQGDASARRRKWLVALVVSLAIFSVWLVAAWQLGVFAVQREWMTMAATRTTRGRRGPWYALDALFTKLPSGIGIYDVPLVALGAIALGRRGGRAARVLVAWIALVSLPLLLTLPDNRYFLPAYPAIAIVAAIGLAQLGAGRARVLALAFLLCGATLAYY